MKYLLFATSIAITSPSAVSAQDFWPDRTMRCATVGENQATYFVSLSPSERAFSEEPNLRPEFKESFFYLRIRSNSDESGFVLSATTLCLEKVKDEIWDIACGGGSLMGAMSFTARSGGRFFATITSPAYRDEDVVDLELSGMCEFD